MKNKWLLEKFLRKEKMREKFSFCWNFFSYYRKAIHCILNQRFYALKYNLISSIISCHIILYCIILYCIVLYYIISYIWYYVMIYHIILYHIMSCSITWHLLILIILGVLFTSWLIWFGNNKAIFIEEEVPCHRSLSQSPTSSCVITDGGPKFPLTSDSTL